jgi:chromosome segregation ATPase
MESTLAAVQAALHRRQLQVNELRANLALAEEAKEQLSNQWKLRSDELESVAKKLDSAKAETTSARAKLGETAREKSGLQEQLDAMQSECSATSRSVAHLEEEMRALTEEKKTLSEALVRSDREVQSSRERMEVAERKCKRLEKEVAEKMALIGKLESV